VSGERADLDALAAVVDTFVLGFPIVTP